MIRITKSVCLAAKASKITAPDGAALVWNLVAYQGEFRGYARGEQPFALDAATFDQVVANLRRHPRYTADRRHDLIPWDASHLSEQPPEKQPPGGAAVLGWVRDLEVRRGEGGRAELWALSRFTADGRRMIEDEGRYASVALAFDAIDPVTGKGVGVELTSIALTPTPFLQDQPLLVAASKGAAQTPRQVAVSLDKYPGRNSTERAIAMLRATVPGADKWSHEQVTAAAWRFVRAAREGAPTIEASVSVAPISASDRPVLDLRMFPGKNRFERIVAACRARLGESARHMTWEQLCSFASEVSRTHSIRE